MEMPRFPTFLAQEDAPPAPPGTIAPQPSAPAGTPGVHSTVQPGAQPLPTAPPPGSGWGQLIFFLAIIAVMWFLLLGGQRREKKKREEMLTALKKGDYVQTIGGVLGTVMDVREHEVVLKVDENNNTKLRFAKSAVQTVLSGESKPQ